MPDITVKQTTIDSMKEMGVDDVSAYLDNIASRHENQKVDSEWNALTPAQKKAKLAVSL